MLVVGLCELRNWTQTTCYSALRGKARLALVVHIFLGSFYGVGLPDTIILGVMMDIGLLGFWLGLLAAQASCVFVLSGTDWMTQTQRVQEMIGVDVENKTITFKQCARKILFLSVV